MILAIILLIGFGAVVLARLYFGREFEDRVEEGEIVDFADLDPAARARTFLMCPPQACNLPADAESPIFAMDWERLRVHWSEMIAHEKHLRLVAGDGDLQKITYVQHSPLLRLPDIVTIQFVAIDATHSSFAIASRSRYEMFDFGGNRPRIIAWVDLLRRITQRGVKP